MHLRHVIFQQLRRCGRRFPYLRRLSITTTLLTLVWLYAEYWGERTVSASAIDACRWSRWEQWPADAVPHHLVFVADPQLVDPHTYPSRPWPISTLTELYTDMYMARNFRLINAELDPDSVVFLGDLLDGGREWATGRVRSMKEQPMKVADRPGIVNTEQAAHKREASEVSEVERGDPLGLQSSVREKEQGSGSAKRKRSMQSYRKALTIPHKHHIEKKDHFLDAQNNDLKEFVHGENGRWKYWDQTQWDIEFARFGRIFFDVDQLYPRKRGQTTAGQDVVSDSLSMQSGGRNVTQNEYGTTGHKPRRIITSLPGNHDVGFGMGVQLAVRDRFQLQFGESNRIDVIGNHTFISLDTPSLSAAGQFLPGGGETQPDQIAELEHTWRPPMDFLEDLRTPAGNAVAETLEQYYPSPRSQRGYSHVVTDPEDPANQPITDDLPGEEQKRKPQLPVILLSHIPLYRDPDTDCGPFRERGHAISISAGYQYQNVVTRSLSNVIANRVSTAGELSYIFSGDDHDYCDITHRYNIAQASTAAKDGSSRGTVLSSVREITVKSFSWAMGVRRPGFLLVSMWNPVDAEGNTVGTPLPTIQTHSCLLPDQLGIFIDYAMLCGVSLIVLLVRALVIGLRSKSAENIDDSLGDSPSRLVLPRFEWRTNGTVNAIATPTRQGTESKGRQRASSTSTSSHNTPSKSSLGVQRSLNARTRSISPANGYAGLPNLQEYTGRGLIENAGFYPQVAWADPGDDDEDEDEEKSVGLLESGEDSQGKWRRRRMQGKAGRVVEEFGVSVLLVGVPAGLVYGWLINNG